MSVDEELSGRGHISLVGVVTILLDYQLYRCPQLVEQSSVEFVSCHQCRRRGQVYLQAGNRSHTSTQADTCET